MSENVVIGGIDRQGCAGCAYEAEPLSTCHYVIYVDTTHSLVMCGAFIPAGQSVCAHQEEGK